MTPQMELAKVVGAHDPDEMDARRSALKPAQRVIGEARAYLRLNVGDHDARPDIEPARGLDAGVERRQASQRFQRIAGRHQPPDAVEREPAQRKTRDERMPLVRWIERSAEETNAHSRRERRQARNGGHNTACAANSSAWRSVVRPSMSSSRPSPSMIRSSE